MAKEKRSLNDLKVQSFVTELGDEQMNRLKGGYIVKGRRYTYRTRWTAVDIRGEATAEAAAPISSGG